MVQAPAALASLLSSQAIFAHSEAAVFTIFITQPFFLHHKFNMGHTIASFHRTVMQAAE